MSVANNGSIDITVCDPETHSPDDTPQSPERGPSHTPRSPGRSPAHRVRQFLSSRSPNKARQCRSLSPPAPASGRLKRYLSPYRTHQPPPRPHARRASSSNSRLAQLLQALLDNGIPEEVIRAKWQWHDCYGTGLLTEDQFVAWYLEMCGLAGMDHSEADAHGVFLALDARSSGHLGIEDALYGEPELQWSPSGKTVAQVPPPKGTLREQYAARVKESGRKFLGNPNEGLVAAVPPVEWAAFPRGADAQFQFCRKAALAVFNIAGGVSHHFLFHKRYAPPDGFALVRRLFAHPHIFNFGVPKEGPAAAADSVLLGVAVEHPEAFVICLRGTCTVGEGMSDMKTKPRKFEGFPGSVHKGFMGVYTESPHLRLQAEEVLREVVAQGSSKPIVIAGHSLGGAVATLLTYDALRWFPDIGRRLILVTFGSPRVGDGKFATGFDAQARRGGLTHFRVANDEDVFTSLPPRPLYRHCGAPVQFSLRLASNFGASCIMNHLQAYKTWLEEDPSAAASRDEGGASGPPPVQAG